MLTGAIIGGVAGIIVYLVQTQMKKKAAAGETLDADVKETKSTENSESN